MWILTDVAGEHAYTETGKFVPFSGKWLPEMASFETAAEAKEVLFILRWAKQLYLRVQELPYSEGGE